MTKKYFVLIILLFLSLNLFACKEISIYYTESSVVLYQNEKYVIDSSKIVNESLDEYSIISLDNTIATVSDYVITPVSVGNTKIRISLMNKPEVFFDINVEIKSGNIAKNVSLESSLVRINMGENKSSLNRITTNTDCDEIPLITYDDNIIEYNYKSGVVTAKSIGRTEVKIKYLKCETAFEVTVHNTIYTQQLNVSDCKIFSNSTGKLEFSVFPKNANTYRFWTSSEDLTILSDGTYTTKNVTSAIIFYQYYEQYNLQSEIKCFKVDVIDKISKFDCSIQNLQGVVSTKFVMNKEYKLVITANGYNQGDFRFSNNIILKSGIEGENGDYYIIFEFKKLGEQQVKVSLIETLGQVENNVTNILNVNVLEEKDITICAKWSAYPIYPNSDGKYYIYLEGNGIRQDSIYFSCMLDEELLYGKTVVYQVLSEDLRLEVDRLFEPQTLGEYIFEIEYEDKLVGQVCVIVA